MISLDALLSTIPLLLIVVLTLSTSSFIAHNTALQMQRQQAFDKVVSIADYTVKEGAVVGADPNWIAPEKINDRYVDGLRSQAGLTKLHISLEEPDEQASAGYTTCIYRVVVVGKTHEIARIFVCGG